jgi:hypothetical protein
MSEAKTGERERERQRLVRGRTSAAVCRGERREIDAMSRLRMRHDVCGVLGLLACLAVGPACSSRAMEGDGSLGGGHLDTTDDADSSTAEDGETQGASGSVVNPYPDPRCRVYPRDFPEEEDCPTGAINTTEASEWDRDVCWAGLATRNNCHGDGDCPHAGVTAVPRCVAMPRDDLCHLVCDVPADCPTGMECLLSRHGFHACYWVARSPLPSYLWRGGCPQSGDGILCETAEDCEEGMECVPRHTGEVVCRWP